MRMNQFLSKAFRRKVMGQGGGTTLARKLGVFDITALGVGSTLGAGIYVITGTVARNTTGPGIVLSFLIAGIASILSGLAYAEFGSRVPKAGSAYVYSFVAVGELIAWLTGWNLILEYIIGASSVARGWSSYFDSLVHHWISHNINDHIPAPAGIDPDIFALFITLVLTLVVAVGVKESTMANNVLTAVNIVVIAVIVIAGSFYAKPANWDPFVPEKFGTIGVFKGAATCFYAYIGFDVIATSAEETKNPSRNVPIGIIASLTICALSYMAVSAILTLMQDYAVLSNEAPLAGAFGAVGATWAKVFISVGALAGLSTSLMASIFPLPRIIYAIASDGLLWPWLGAVHPYFKTPLNATLISGLLAGIMAFLLNIQELAEMLSIGTLISYTMVGACVIILRYERPNAAMAAHLADAAAAGGAAATEAAPLVSSRGVFAETPKQSTPQPMQQSSRRQRAASMGGGSGVPLPAHRTGVAGSLPAPASARASTNRDRAASETHEEYTALASDDDIDVAAPAAGVGSSGALMTAHTPDAVTAEAGRALGQSAEHVSLVAGEGEVEEDNEGAGWWESFAAAARGQAMAGNRFRAAVVCVLLYLLCVTIVSVSILVGVGQVWAYVVIGIFGLAAVAMVGIANRIPERAQPNLKFKCPWVPTLPMVSMGINMYLLCSLSPLTWARFAVWSAIGFAIYFWYGITHSRVAEKAAAAMQRSKPDQADAAPTDSD